MLLPGSRDGPPGLRPDGRGKWRLHADLVTESYYAVSGRWVVMALLLVDDELLRFAGSGLAFPVLFFFIRRIYFQRLRRIVTRAFKRLPFHAARICIQDRKSFAKHTYIHSFTLAMHV